MQGMQVAEAVLVTSVRPSSPMPPITSVAQIGSPEKSVSNSGVRRKRTMRIFMMKWSISSGPAPHSAFLPACRVQCRYRGTRPCAPATSPRRSGISLRQGRQSRPTAPLPAHSSPDVKYQSHSSSPSAGSAAAHVYAPPAPRAGGSWPPVLLRAPVSTRSAN